VKKFAPGFIVLTVIIMLQGCGSSDPPNAKSQGHSKATSVEVAAVTPQTISEQIRAYGNVETKDVVQVTPQVSNRITHIYARLGDTVKAGQKLAEIRSATYQDQVAQAKSSVSQSRAAFEQDSAQYARQKKLYKMQLISQSTLDQAKADYLSSKSQLQSAKSSLSQSKEDLNNSVLRSPVYGVVIARNVGVGDLASTGKTAFEIGNLTGYQMRIYLPRDEWKEMKLGQKALFQLADDQLSPAAGRVSHISPRLDPTTGLGQVIISFTKKGADIAQGMLIKAIVNVETHQDAIVIPRSALVENVKTVIQPESNIIQTERTYAAFVVQGDSLALKHKLTLGIEQGNKVEVLKGLKMGDKIVTTGQANLQDSASVQVANGSQFQNDSMTIKKESERADSSSTNADGN
jgi:RND family efflux transporter MFP subunit